MTREELVNVFKYIVKKCDRIINNDKYKPDEFTQDTVEDIAELCNHILDGDYGKLIEDYVPENLKWKKKFSELLCHERTNCKDFAYMGNDTCKPCICMDGYYISLAQLEHLPKDDQE